MVNSIISFFESYIDLLSQFLLSEPFIYIFGFVIVCVIFEIIALFFNYGGLKK